MDAVHALVDFVSRRNDDQCRRLRTSLVAFAATLANCRARAGKRRRDMEASCLRRQIALQRVETQLACLQGALHDWALSRSPPAPDCMLSMTQANAAHLDLVQNEHHQLDAALRDLHRQARHDALLVDGLAASAVAAHLDWLRCVADNLPDRRLSRSLAALAVVVASGYGTDLLDYLVALWAAHDDDGVAAAPLLRGRVTPDPDCLSRPLKRHASATALACTS